MTTNQQKAFDQLKALGCPVFTRPDDADKTFHISAEAAGHEAWADYYPERQSYPFESPKIAEVLRPLGLIAEWDDPGSLSIWN